MLSTGLEPSTSELSPEAGAARLLGQGPLLCFCYPLLTEVRLILVWTILNFAYEFRWNKWSDEQSCLMDEIVLNLNLNPIILPGHVMLSILC